MECPEGRRVCTVGAYGEADPNPVRLFQEPLNSEVTVPSTRAVREQEMALLHRGSRVA